LNDGYGFYLDSSSNNSIYHNNIINNTIQAFDNMNNNFWNDTYPSGGNYWSDYDGVDLNSSPAQDVPPPDGIGDTSYIIDADSQDYYPLMEPIILPPSAPQNLQAYSGNRCVNLTWTVPFSDGGSPVTSYNIYRNGTLGIYTSVSASQLWYNDTNVTNGVTYTYSVSAVNIAGEGQNSTIIALPMTVPSAPLNLQANAGYGYVNLTWFTPTDNGGSAITNYIIYRGEVSGGETFLTDIGNITYFNDTSVTGGVTYFYQVKAVNIVGEGPFSNEASAHPVSEPSAPTGLTATSGDSFIWLTWNAPTSDGGFPITNYKIYRGTISNGEILLAVIGNVTYYDDMNVTNGITYYYKVSAFNIIGESPLSTEINATPGYIPSAPTDLTATAGSNYVYVTWNAPASDGGNPITNYRIYKGTTSDGETFFIDIGNITYYNDTSVFGGVTYYYKASAINLIGEGPLSNEDNGTPISAPDTPTNITALSGDTYVNFTWESPSNDGGSQISGYNIYRNGIPGIYAYVSANQLWYNDTNVINGITYPYYVSAINIVGEGPNSTVSGTPMTVPSAPENLQANVGDSHVYLTWEIPSDDGGSPITGYNIYRYETSGIFAFIPVNQLWYNDTNAVNGINYTYNISAINIVGEGPTSTISGTPMTAPSAPTNLRADAGDGYVNIAWEVPLSDGGSPIVNYRIYRSTISGDETFLEEIGNILTYNDTSVTNNITYFYKVSAQNTVGEGPFSNEADATPKTSSAVPEKPSDEDDEIPWLWIIIPIIIAVCAIILFIIAYKRRKRKEGEPPQES
jgi:fibronectin type 3 domain-containing protein